MPKRLLIVVLLLFILYKEQLGEEMGKKITRIKLQTVKIADKKIVMINGICTFKMKLGDLLVETVTVYTFLFESIHLILRLPSLIKHNSQIDWPTPSYKFTRNRLIISFDLLNLLLQFKSLLLRTSDIDSAVSH